MPDRALEHWNYIEAHSAPTERPLVLQQIAHIQQGAGHHDAAITALEKALALTGPGNWLREELEAQLGAAAVSGEQGERGSQPSTCGLFSRICV